VKKKYLSLIINLRQKKGKGRGTGGGGKGDKVCGCQARSQRLFRSWDGLGVRGTSLSDLGEVNEYADEGSEEGTKRRYAKNHRTI